MMRDVAHDHRRAYAGRLERRHLLVFGEFERRADIDDVAEIAQSVDGNEQVFHGNATKCADANGKLSHGAACRRARGFFDGARRAVKVAGSSSASQEGNHDGLSRDKRQETIGARRRYRFDDLKTLLARASPCRSGDELAGIAAATEEERVAAKLALAQVPLRAFLDEPLIPYEDDEVTRLIVDTHSAEAFAPIAHLSVGAFREWLLADTTDTAALERASAGITPEMAAAMSKLMRNQDLILAAKKRPVVTRFRTTIGLPGHLSVRLQPNHPTDDVKGIAASMLDGLLYGCGDAVIGINPASDSPAAIGKLFAMMDDFRRRYNVPM